MKLKLMIQAYLFKIHFLRQVLSSRFSYIDL